MGRRPRWPALEVLMNGRKVGALWRDPDGAFGFRYASSWLAWEHRMPVSLSLPLREDRYSGAAVIAVFDNLLPDHSDIRRRLAARVGAEGTDAYSLLARIGRDCVGALQFLPADADPGPAGLRGAPLSEPEIAALLRDLKASPLGLRREREFRISVAGAQDKTALLYAEGQWLEPHGTTPTTHIFKPAIGPMGGGMDLRDSVENEHFCLALLGAFGLPVAQSRIAQFEEIRVLIVERFDRRFAKDGRLLRLPQEDCCQALGVPPERKYQSDGGPGIGEIATLLRGSDQPQRDQDTFFKAVVLFWLMGATDGHAKNFSLRLAPGGRFQLAPLYDVISLEPGLAEGWLQPRDMRLAMRAGRNRHYRVEDLLGRHFIETGSVAGLSPARVQAIFEEIRLAADHAFEAALAQMPEGFPGALAEQIRSGFFRRMPRM